MLSKFLIEADMLKLRTLLNWDKNLSNGPTIFLSEQAYNTGTECTALAKLLCQPLARPHEQYHN